MKIFSPLSELPELQELPPADRHKVIAQWQHEADRSAGFWLSSLCYLGFIVFVQLPLMVLPPIALSFPKPFIWVWIGITVWTGPQIYDRVVILRRSDILERILGKRGYESKQSMNLSPEETARNRAEVFIGLSVLIGGFGTLCILLGAAQAYRGQPYVVWAVLGLASLLLCVYLAIAARGGKQ